MEPRQMLAADLAAGSLGGQLGQTGGPTGSISGSVYATQAVGSCDSHGVANSLADVRVQLLNESGTVLEERLTDDEGAYRFSDLLPGQYSVRQITPAGFFEGASHVGAGGGIALDMNQVGEIQVQANETLSGYDFCDYTSAPEPAGPADRPIVPHGGEAGSQNQVLPFLSLSLQQPSAASTELIYEPVIVLATGTESAVTSPLVLSRPAEIFGGSSRSLKESAGIKTWDEYQIDDWFSTVSALDLASSELTTIEELEPFLDGAEEHSDAPFADGYTVNTIEWWQGDARVKLDQLVGDTEVIHIDTEQAATDQAATPQLARRVDTVQPL